VFSGFVAVNNNIQAFHVFLVVGPWALIKKPNRGDGARHAFDMRG
jgi:hypothetical protein